MNSSTELTILADRIHGYLMKLCENLPNRHVGSPGNRAATDFFAKTIASFGFRTESPEFDCIDWEPGEVHLAAGGESYAVQISPYSTSCNVTTPLVAAGSLDELEKLDLGGKVLLLYGDLTQEQLIPKNFPFYIPTTYPNLIALLEEKRPAAIIAATTRNPELAGAWYPFPLIEDGDFDIPSVFMTEEEGTRLRAWLAGGNDDRDVEQVTLHIESERIPAEGQNVIARKGSDTSARLVVCAHIDTKKGTPGALDNATGVATLLALAELLTEYVGERCVEIVALNGEDYYAASGQVQYLKENEGAFTTIALAINLDVAGSRAGETVYSAYGCDEITSRQLQEIFEQYELQEGPSWYQSDHSLFIQQGVPAVALTSSNFIELSTDITHTEKDMLDLVDCHKLAIIALVLRDVATELA